MSSPLTMISFPVSFCLKAQLQSHYMHTVELNATAVITHAKFSATHFAINAQTGPMRTATGSTQLFNSHAACL